MSIISLTERDSKGRFVKGHISARKNMTLEEEYGEEKAKEIRRKNREGHIGHVDSEETKEKKREAQLRRKERDGYIQSPEARKKISESLKGKNNPNYGKHPTEEQNRKRMEALKGKKRPPFSDKWKRNIGKSLKGKFKGEDNPNYIDGRSFKPYTSEFNEQLKELIRYRDGYKCQKCGCPEIEEGQKLAIHHIDYIKENCEPNNLIALCRSCNSKINSNHKRWIKYFNRKIKKIMISNQIQLNFRYKKVRVKCQ